MAPQTTKRSAGGSFLLELLWYAGWRLDVRTGSPASVRATRAGVEIDVTAASLPQAAGTVFARAMRPAGGGVVGSSR